MLTSARPRTLVLAVSDEVIDVAMLGPRGGELGMRQVLPVTADVAALWTAIETFGEFDRITLIGSDPAGAAAQIARESQRPLRHMSHGALRWQSHVLGEEIELALTLGSRFGSAAYFRGIELPGFDLGKQLVRKDKRVREYLAPQVAQKKGREAWQRRVARAVDELIGVWNPTVFHIAAPLTLPLPALPARVIVAPATSSLDGALSVWESAPPQLAALPGGRLQR